MSLVGERLSDLDKKLLRSLSARIEKAVSDRSRYPFDVPDEESGRTSAWGIPAFTDSWRRRTLAGGGENRILLYNDSQKAGWLTGGTGIFGPHGQRIYPQNSYAMKFYWHAIGRWVTVRSVKGINPLDIGSRRYNLESVIRNIITDEMDAFMREEAPDTIERIYYGDE